MKLTLVSFQCRNKRISTFIKLPYKNGKPVIAQSTINKLFRKYFGFTPEQGETITQ